MTTACPRHEAPNRDLVDSWSLTSMGNHLDATACQGAMAYATLADQLIAGTGTHLDVMLALARAENASPAADTAWHTARTDAFAAEHGLRGWYRDDKAKVCVNKLRTPFDGERGRYFYYEPSRFSLVRCYTIIDRDSGRTVANAPNFAVADEWIRRAETPEENR